MRIQSFLSIFLFISPLFVAPVMAEETKHSPRFEKWIRSAEQGDAEAQFNLGLMYGNGLGVLQDYKEAYIWLNIATAQGHKNGKEARDLVANKLDPATLSEAQELSKEYYKKYVEPFQ